MNTKTDTMKKTVLKFGFYGALTICLLFFISWFLLDGLSYNLQEVIGYAGMILSLSFVYFGIRHYRNHENNGKVSFKKALIIGILISLITALAFGILDVIYVEFLNPSFMDDYYAHAVEELQKTLPKEEFEMKLAEMNAEKEMFMYPVVTFIVMGITVFIIGFIMSLISALILQSKK